MRTILLFITILFTLFISFSCEELIDIDLNESNPRYVIEADLTTLTSSQFIKISTTVPFNQTTNSDPVTNAVVFVQDKFGNKYDFNHDGKGIYSNQRLKPTSSSYYLNVKIGDEVFESTTTLNNYVNVDSLVIVKETVFGEEMYSLNFKFNDPKGVKNFYKYDLSVNGKPFKHAFSFSDKFNDGQFVTHQITDRNETLSIGDTLTVRRQCIAEDVFNYWNELQMINPGSAAPGNPTSNISNGALGYFNVSSDKIYGARIKD